MIPTIPGESGELDDIVDFTEDDNYAFMCSRVSKFSGSPYVEVGNLPCDEFLLLYKNSIIEQMLSTEEGRQKLKRIKRLTETKCDLKGLRALKKRLEGKEG
ncbi:MAG: hypothetical protein J6F30_08160 [Cellulosilyticum sp.]|nr:hypothetical protein [Cellulosilyticum sp.]